MIDLTQERLAELLLQAFCVGIALGIFYDSIRFLKMFFFISYKKSVRYLKERGKRAVAYAVTFFTDLVFWLIAGLASILLLYGVDGIFRGMTYPAIFAGFLVYYLTLGKIVVSLSEKIAAFIKKAVKKLLHLLLYPLRAIWKGIILLYHLTIGKILGKIKEKMQIARKRRETKMLALKAASEDENAPCGKDDLAYVDGKTGYKREGRISFGQPRT